MGLPDFLEEGFLCHFRHLTSVIIWVGSYFFTLFFRRCPNINGLIFQVNKHIIIYSYIRKFEDMKASDIQSIAESATEMLKVLSNSTRLMIVCRLIEGESSVGKLADSLGIRASTVSQHLQVLRLGDLVSTRRDGQTIYYSLANSALEDIIGALHKNFCVALPRSTAPKR